MKNNILNTLRNYKFAIATLTALSLLGWSSESNAQVAFTGTPYTQDFDTLATTGGSTVWANNTTLAGWYLFNKNSGGTPLTSIIIDNGSSATGSFASYGTTSSTERALGGAASGGGYYGSPSTGAVAGWMAVSLVNNTGGAINSVAIRYDGEEWKNGGNTAAQSMVMEYGFGSTFTGVTTWTAAGSAFNFTSPKVSASGTTPAALDGNAAANRVANIGGTLSLASAWAAASNLWIRWIENNDAGNDHGLAVDNFSFSTVAAPVVSYAWSGGNGTWQNGQSGNFGTTYNNNTDYPVTFSGTSGDVAVSSGVQAGSLSFTTGGYALNSGSLTVGLGAITTDTGTTTINSVLEGTAGLIKSGAGALVLTGANTVTGAVSITGGTLQIGSDGALGNAANDIANNGTLKTTSNIALGAGRDITGSGTLDIADGTTLTVNGVTSTSGLTLANTGTLAFNNAASNPGNLTTTYTSGTARVTGNLNLGATDKIVNVAGGGALEVAGTVSLTTGTGTELTKEGAGTLILSGSGSSISRVQIGRTGATPTAGGTLRVADSASLGAQEMYFNYGTLEAANNLSTSVGVSLGGRNGAETVIGGSGGSADVTFNGAARFFGATGTSGEFALKVNNNTTLAGGISGAAGTRTGVTLGGNGTLNITGNSSTFTDTITTADTVKLVVNNTLGAGVNVGSGSLLSGSGSVGAISGAGTVGPGNSPGILTATSVNPNAGTDFRFEFTALNPTYTSATASGNDLLHLTSSSSPFAGGTFGSGNIISIYLNSSTINDSLLAGTNTSFSGGFFVDGTYGLAAALSPASFAYYTTSSLLGTGSAVNYGGTDYYLLNSEIAAKTTLSDTAVTGAGFATGTATGTLLTFNAVPEPSAQSLLAFGMAALVAVRSLRRRQS